MRTVIGRKDREKKNKNKRQTDRQTFDHQVGLNNVLNVGQRTRYTNKHVHVNSTIIICSIIIVCWSFDNVQAA